MKIIEISSLTSVLLFLYLDTSVDFVFTSSLSGDFFTELKYAGPCPANESGKNLIQYNLKSVRDVNGRKYLTGNITYLIPFDDNLQGVFQLEKFSPSTGRFTANYFRITLNRICSDTYRYMGELWKNFQRIHGIPIGCPTPRGTYVVNEYDVNALFDQKGATIATLPKSFFYGKYKLNMIFEKNKDIVGCHVEIVECKPTWQKHKEKDN